MATRVKKTWAEKLADDKDLPRTFSLEGKASRRWGEGTMVIPAPREVDALMKRVPKGRLVTINEIRIALAQQHRTTMACPITTGIFAWIAAHAAAEAGEKRGTTPYWRTLKNGGEVNPKYPGGSKLRGTKSSSGARGTSSQILRSHWPPCPEFAGGYQAGELHHFCHIVR